MRSNTRGQVMGPHPYGTFAAAAVGAAIAMNLDPVQAGASEILFGAVGIVVGYALYTAAKHGLVRAWEASR